MLCKYWKNVEQRKQKLFRKCEYSIKINPNKTKAIQKKPKTTKHTTKDSKTKPCKTESMKTKEFKENLM